MKSLNTKLLLSALGIALLATPAFAQRPERHTRTVQTQSQDPAVGHSQEYAPGYGNVDAPPSNEW
jgi:hypothetical protein